VKNFLQKIVLIYGYVLPYHPGKWRIVEKLVSLSGGVPAGLHRAIRRGVAWELNLAGLVERSLYYLGVYEVHESVYLESKVQQDWVICDIGANFGYYAHTLSAATHGQATVHAFEPSAAMYKALVRNQSLNPSFARLHTWNLALSDRVGQVALKRAPELNQGLGRLELNGGSGEDYEQVETCTLDQFSAEQALQRLDFIKIDVEGAEALVLEGAAETVQRFRPLMMIEINPEALATFGVDAEALLSRIKHLGYTLYRLHGRQLIPLEGLSDEDEYVNAICLPDSI
jgi:FkbM family methyltransferase